MPKAILKLVSCCNLKSKIVREFMIIELCRRSSTEIDIKSNLTLAEQRGMKSLQERVKQGEIVVTETDKSRRFCVLTRSQYNEAGMKHTSKDEKISTLVVNGAMEIGFRQV